MEDRMIEYNEIVDLETLKGYLSRYDPNVKWAVRSIIAAINDGILREATKRMNGILDRNTAVNETSGTEKETIRKDMVNHPSHYANKGIEVIDYIRDTLTPDGFTEYCGGNVLKYVSRWRHKGGVEDLRMAKVYLGWMIESAEKEMAGV